MESLLQVRNLQVEYGGGVHPVCYALRGASLEVGEQETVGIFGESGSGKSTLALALLGILPGAARVTGGSISFRNRELADLPEPEWRGLRGAEISMVFQDHVSALNPVVRIGTQVADVVAAHRPWSRRQCREAAAAMLQETGLEPSRFCASFPHQLSGGQRQRALIAQALVCGPALLVADEPTGSLDNIAQAEILGLLNRLCQERPLAVIFISHNPAVLSEVAERLLVMYAGQVVEEGPAAEVMNNPLHPYTRCLLECVPQFGRNQRPVAGVPGSPPDATEPAPGCAFEPRCGERMAACGARAPNLSVLFPRHGVRCSKYGD